jgi:hypothetical protein
MIGAMRFVLASFLLVACNSGSSNDRTTPDANTCPVSKETTLTIDSVTPLGSFSAPPTIKTFSGGASAKLGDTVLWTFAEAVLNGGAETRSSIFGFSSVGDAWRPWIVVDTKGVPNELIPLTEEERAHNLAKPEERFVVWPTGAIGTGLEAVVFYGKFTVKPGVLDISAIEGGIAHVRKGEGRARDRLPIFKTADPLFGLGPTLVGDQVYAWACIEGGCVLGRAPLSRVAERAAWAVWDGSAYNADLTKGSKMITNAPGDLSMSYNGWLRKYLVVHSESFTDKVVIHTADKPEGPWSSPIVAFQTGGDQYAGKEHVALSAPCGETIVVTHFARTSGSTEYVGELRATSLKLR